LSAREGAGADDPGGRQNCPLPLGGRTTGKPTEKPINRIDTCRGIRRRTAEAGFKMKLGCYVFRATGIAAYLEAGGTLENATGRSVACAFAGSLRVRGGIVRALSAAPAGRERLGLPSAPRDTLMSVKVRVAACTRIFRNAGTDRTRRRGAGTFARNR